MTDLEGKVAIVTGGSSGIGKAIAARYVEDGANVVICDIDDEAGEAAAEEIGATYKHCDVSHYEAVTSLVDSVAEEHGGLDIIVNNAGIGRATPLEDMSIEEWDSVIGVNLTGVMNGCKAAMPYLKEAEGAIINVASIYGMTGGPGAPAYTASKGAVVNLTRTLAVDHATDAVNVNAICPGFVRTAMTEDYLEDESFYGFVTANTPMGRVAEPEEMTGIAALLASDDASYITGAIIPVDGGWTAH